MLGHDEFKRSKPLTCEKDPSRYRGSSGLRKLTPYYNVWF